MTQFPRDCENVFVLVWSALERGDATLEKLFVAHPHIIPVVAQLEADGWLVREGGQIRFSPEGEAKAQELVRRNRLAEVLLQEVLEVHPERVPYNACLWEHVLSPEVTDNICTFLGHPRHCPHGNPIPPGPCCKQTSRTVTPLVQPLTSLHIGASARITFIAPKVHRRLDRLAALGIVPGTLLTLKQKSPSYVVRFDETEVALEEEVARDIFVRELANGERRS